jgi:hypothetical protein
MLKEKKLRTINIIFVFFNQKESLFYITNFDHDDQHATL